MILCWAAFIAVLGCMRPVGCGLNTPVRGTSRTHLAVGASLEERGLNARQENLGFVL